MEQDSRVKVETTSFLQGFTPVSNTRIFWRSRKRSAIRPNSDEAEKTPSNSQKEDAPAAAEKALDLAPRPMLSAKRKALFEPLEPIDMNGRRPSAESLLPPPDFDSAAYPRGWLIGKKRKLVNVDVVESMRRIAIQEMNRKDREIDGLNEQLEEDARCLEHLQLQLLQEKSKRAEAEREKSMLQDQIDLLMSLLQENDSMADEDHHET
ncbi:hypothetical protein SAY86_001549 [Trapa natans]|uniref:Protein HEADING DATE REPRESSOR 1 n=1 Tax=Trapa natans TaxID=22666 RepID=A0AAN7N143_TRANT|nr:hypothetical protein SAY86_001549 [Trapa natans]